jgi:Tol biopolymer transport system component
VLLFSLGCYSPHYGDCEIACGAAGCPSGLQCDGTYCRTEPHPNTVCPGGGMADAATDAPTVPWDKPWGTPYLVLSDSAAALDDPSLTGDLTQMLVTGAGTGQQIYRSTYSGTAWSALVPESSLNSGGVDRGASITEDGQSVYWASTRSGGLGNTDVWVATGSWAGWTSAMNVPSASSAMSDERPAVTKDLLTIVLDSNRNNVNDYDIFISTRSTTAAPWPAPTPITEINSGSIEEAPMLSDDGLTIYFDSNRSGQFDIYAAHRTAIDQPFGTPVALNLNDPSADDFSPWISGDQRTMFFVSRRATSNAQVFEATR